MVIRPHKSFDEVCDSQRLICFHTPAFLKFVSLTGLFSCIKNGFDYLLTYSDNPQTVFPRYCVSWMVSSGELVLCGCL